MRTARPVSGTEWEITLMPKCRTRLTADVVTGILGVRHAAAKFPDLTGTVPEPATEAAEEIETDEGQEG